MGRCLAPEKPPLIYWLQVATMKVAGDTGEAARFPSTIATLLTALILGVVVRRFVGDRRALWSVFIFCTAGLVVASAKFCITDATMMFFVVIGQACLAEMYFATSRRAQASGGQRRSSGLRWGWRV